MSTLRTRLTRALRDVPLARAAVVRLRTFGLPGASFDNGVLILCYHDMRAGQRGRFERQLRRLRDRADIIGLSDAVRLLADGRVDGRFVCLTFDDGYRGAFDNAFPVLVDQNAPASFFVVSGWIDENRPDIIGWAECRRLAANGIEIGSHTVTHPHLANLHQSEVEAELTISRNRIEAELGQPCVHFACPFGQPAEDFQRQRDPGLTRAAGYRTFLTTTPRFARAGDDPWALPRVRMEPAWGEAELRYAFSR